MDKNDSFTPQEKRDKNRLVVIVSILVMAVLLVADLYIMINMPTNYLALAGITVLFLVSVYFFINAILKEMNKSKLRAEEQYEAIAKSGKASYLLLKKAFDQLEEIEESTKKPVEDVIAAQKALAKVTINRNKENADAVMNSNDKVLEKLFDVEEKLGTSQNDLLDKQLDMMDDSMKELAQKQQEMASSMREMELSIKNELLQAMNSIQTMQTSQSIPLQQPEIFTESAAEEFPVFEEPSVTDDSSISESVLTDDLGLEDDLSLGADLGLGDDINLGSDLGLGDDINLGSDLGLGETTISDDLGISESALPDDLGISESALPDDLNLGMDLGLGDDLGLDMFSEETPVMEDTLKEEPLLEAAAAGENNVAAEPVMPDLSDPHKLMTPDEIAALIANM